MEDKRQYIRISFDAEANLSLDGQRWDAELVDISLKGALISKPEGFTGELEQSGSLVLLLPNSDIVLKMDVTLVHVREDALGLRCDQIDIDSMTHLRRIVEFNTGHPHLLERELTAMCAA